MTDEAERQFASSEWISLLADVGSRFDGATSSVIALSLIQVVASVILVVAGTAVVATRSPNRRFSGLLLRFLRRGVEPGWFSPDVHLRSVRLTLGLFVASTIITVVGLPTNLWALSTDIRTTDNLWLPLTALSWLAMWVSALVLFGWGAGILVEWLARSVLRGILRSPLLAAGAALVVALSAGAYVRLL